MFRAMMKHVSLNDLVIAPGPAKDVSRISDTLTRMRLLMGRRIIGRIAIANVAPELDLSHLDVLDVMRRIDRDGGEVTVGAVAEMMRIDPSRGSRVVADLVSRGVLQRAASQADGRRSVIERTALGDRLLQEIRAVKKSLLAKVLENWEPAEVDAFSVLFERFMDDFEAVYSLPDRGEATRSQDES
jgi:DNA-binding MarR family transcriptional regulator